MGIQVSLDAWFEHTGFADSLEYLVGNLELGGLVEFIVGQIVPESIHEFDSKERIKIMKIDA